MASEGDIRTQGTQIAAEKGATFLASNNIELGTAEEYLYSSRPILQIKDLV